MDIFAVAFVLKSGKVEEKQKRPWKYLPPIVDFLLSHDLMCEIYIYWFG